MKLQIENFTCDPDPKVAMISGNGEDALGKFKIIGSVSQHHEVQFEKQTINSATQRLFFVGMMNFARTEISGFCGPAPDKVSELFKINAQAQQITEPVKKSNPIQTQRVETNTKKSRNAQTLQDFFTNTIESKSSTRSFLKKSSISSPIRPPTAKLSKLKSSSLLKKQEEISPIKPFLTAKKEPIKPKYEIAKIQSVKTVEKKDNFQEQILSRDPIKLNFDKRWVMDDIYLEEPQFLEKYPKPNYMKSSTSVKFQIKQRPATAIDTFKEVNFASTQVLTTTKLQSKQNLQDSKIIDKPQWQSTITSKKIIQNTPAQIKQKFTSNSNFSSQKSTTSFILNKSTTRSSIDTAKIQKPEIKETQDPQKFLTKNNTNNVQDSIIQKYERIVKAGLPFTDPDFPPNDTSMYDTVHDQDKIELFKNTQWKRASEIFDKPQVYFDGIATSNVKQGNIGDCYFIATLGAAAKDPQRIKDRFYSNEPNTAGIYLLKLFVNGLVKYVILDDYLPVENNRIRFARSSREGELWPSLIEKAWAKLLGTYARIISGNPADAIIHVMGIPAKGIFHEPQNNQLNFDKEEVWNQIYKASNRKCEMIATSKKGDNQKPIQGIAHDHAYGLPSAQIVNYNGQQIKLIQLRNPWGTNSYSGEWSSKSEIWTPELKEQLQFDENDLGVCFMPFDNFLNLFECSSISVEVDYSKYVHSNLIHNFTNSKYTYAFFELEIKTNIDLTKEIFSISCIQQGNRLKRYRLKGSEKFQHSNFSISFFDIDGQFITNGYGGSFMVSALINEGQLKSGSYLIVLDAFWNQQVITEKIAEYQKVLLDIYSTQQVELKNITHQRGVEIITKGFKLLAQKSTDRHSFFKNHPNYGEKLYQVCDLSTTKTNFGVVYMNNESKTQISLVLNLKLENYQILNHSSKNKKDIKENSCTVPISISLKPGEDIVVILKKLKLFDKCGISFDYQIDAKYKTYAPGKVSNYQTQDTQNQQLWSEMSIQQQNTVLDNLSKIYDEAGDPEWLQYPTLSGFIQNYLYDEKDQKILERQLCWNVKGTGAIGDTSVNLLKEKISQALNCTKQTMLEINESIKIGDSFITIENIQKVATQGSPQQKGENSIIHTNGQVLLIDFWGTWCGPCQQPMQHNEDILIKNRKRWGNKVRIIGIAHDSEVNLIKHLNSKRWKEVEQFIRGPQFNAHLTYSINAVPRVLLIDTNGKLVYFGHPSNRELDKDIDCLLDGQQITGFGTGTQQAQKCEIDISQNNWNGSINEAITLFQNFYDQSLEFNKAYEFELRKIQSTKFNAFTLKFNATYNCKMKNWFINVKAVTEDVHFDGLDEEKISEITGKITKMFGAKLFDQIRKSKFIENGRQSWTSLSNDNKDSILERLVEIYEQFNYPFWLEFPKFTGSVGVSFDQSIFIEQPLKFIINGVGPKKLPAIIEIQTLLNEALDCLRGSVVQIKSALQVSQMYETIDKIKKIYPKSTQPGSETSVDHVKGQVLLIQFLYNTTQKSQQDIQKVFNQNKVKWGENARLVYIINNIERSAFDIIKQLEETGETQFFIKDQGYNSNVTYNINTYPDAILIDTQGKIVFKGYPNRDFQKDIDLLLQGQELTGEGTQQNPIKSYQQENQIKWIGSLDEALVYLQNAKKDFQDFFKSIKKQDLDKLKQNNYVREVKLILNATFDCKQKDWLIQFENQDSTELDCLDLKTQAKIKQQILKLLDVQQPKNKEK